MEQIITADYAQAVKAIKQAIVVCRYRAARQMNGEVLGLYYSIGKYISEQSRNAQWGTGAIRTISERLQQEIPGLRGFSEGNMRKMRLFYEAWQPVFEPQMPESFIVPYTDKIEPIDFRSTVANELTTTKCSPLANELTKYDLECFLSIGFTLHSDIILQTKEVSERIFYIRKAASEFIGKRQLQLLLKSDLYHTAGSMPNNFALTLPDDKQRTIAMQTFKEDNVLDFLHIEDPDFVDEHDVEQQIVNNVRKFMMSLGNDFAFMGNQYRLIVNNKEHFCAEIPY